MLCPFYSHGVPMIFISSEFFEVLLLLNLPKSSVAGTFVDVGSFMPPARRGGRDGECMACGHVVVNDGWLDM